MKRIQGLIAATFITGIVAVGMVGIGANAISNPNSVAVSDSPAKTAQTAQAASGAATSAASDQTTAEINQLQSLIKQYQSREQQYQTEIKSLSQKLSDANAVADQAQQILQALQERGIIQITQDGRILLRGG